MKRLFITTFMLLPLAQDSSKVSIAAFASDPTFGSTAGVKIFVEPQEGFDSGRALVPAKLCLHFCQTNEEL